VTWTETSRVVGGLKVGERAERTQVTRSLEIDGLPVSVAAQMLLDAAAGLTEPTVLVFVPWGGQAEVIVEGYRA
jgi:hypothetical protein